MLNQLKLKAINQCLDVKVTGKSKRMTIVMDLLLDLLCFTSYYISAKDTFICWGCFSTSLVRHPLSWASNKNLSFVVLRHSIANRFDYSAAISSYHTQQTTQTTTNQDSLAWEDRKLQRFIVCFAFSTRRRRGKEKKWLQPIPMIQVLLLLLPPPP